MFIKRLTTIDPSHRGEYKKVLHRIKNWSSTDIQLYIYLEYEGIDGLDLQNVGEMVIVSTTI